MAACMPPARPLMVACCGSSRSERTFTIVSHHSDISDHRQGLHWDAGAAMALGSTELVCALIPPPPLPRPLRLSGAPHFTTLATTEDAAVQRPSAPAGPYSQSRTGTWHAHARMQEPSSPQKMSPGTEITRPVTPRFTQAIIAGRIIPDYRPCAWEPQSGMRSGARPWCPMVTGTGTVPVVAMPCDGVEATAQRALQLCCPNSAPFCRLTYTGLQPAVGKCSCTGTQGSSTLVP